MQVLRNLKSSKAAMVTLLATLAAWSGGAVWAMDLTPTLQGQFVQGGMVVGQTQPGAQVRLDDQTLQVSPAGEFVFGFGRDETGTVTLTIESANNEQWSASFVLGERQFDIQRVDGVPQETVTPDEATQQQISADAEQVWHARQPRTDLTYFAGDFIWPAEGPVTGVYGSQRILNGEPRAPHYGLDIAADTGSPAYAPASGVITMTAPDMVLSGGTLIIDHGHGIFSTFLHLDEILVAEGDYVEQGEHIADIGATGRATGPHLDWRINWGSVRLDPELVLPPEPERY